VIEYKGDFFDKIFVDVELADQILIFDQFGAQFNHVLGRHDSDEIGMKRVTVLSTSVYVALTALHFSKDLVRVDLQGSIIFDGV
jgi:hypothetical protein